MDRFAEGRFASTLKSADLIWYLTFYGMTPAIKYRLILGMNNGGGNYGPRLVHSEGTTELFSIVGCWTHDDAGQPTYSPDRDCLATIIHEFSHSFVNLAVKSAGA